MKWKRFVSDDGDDFEAGDWNAICDNSGFKVKASQLVRQWNGMMVRRDLEEKRNPQDFLRGKKESSIPWGRPEPTDNFGQTDESEL